MTLIHIDIRVTTDGTLRVKWTGMLVDGLTRRRKSGVEFVATAADLATWIAAMFPGW